MSIELITFNMSLLPSLFTCTAQDCLWPLSKILEAEVTNKAGFNSYRFSGSGSYSYPEVPRYVTDFKNIHNNIPLFKASHLSNLL